MISEKEETTSLEALNSNNKRETVTEILAGCEAAMFESGEVQMAADFVFVGLPSM